MAPLCEIAQLEDEQYQVTAWRGHAEEEGFAFEPLASQEQAELVCDLLTIKAALEFEEPLASLQLRSQAGPPMFQLSARAAELISNTDWEELAEELQDCAELLQSEKWQFGGCSPAGMLLLAAATRGKTCTAQLLLLLQPGAAGATGGPSAASPLHQAAEGGHLAVMQAILAAMPGAVHLKSATGCSPLLHAASTAQAAAVRLLLELAPAAAVQASSSTGALPLHMAANAGAKHAEEEAVEETLRLLLDAAPETALAVDFDGETPLFWATASRCEAAVRLLLAAAPAAATVADTKGNLPVHLAAEEGSATTLQLLLDAAPASITAASGQEGQQPIHCAAAHGNIAALETLLAAQPDLVAAVDSDRWTAAHYAARRGYLPALQLLMATAPGRSLHTAQDWSGWTPACVAAQQGHAAVVAQLLTAGPDSAEAATHGGLTPLDIALLHCQDPDKRDAVARLLLPVGSAAGALESLLEAGLAGERLLPDFVAARLPLSVGLWIMLPSPCPGLGHLLPAALACSTEQAYHLVHHLPDADAARLRLGALCLARTQRRTRVHLPPSITGLIIALSCA